MKIFAFIQLSAISYLCQKNLCQIEKIKYFLRFFNFVRKNMYGQQKKIHLRDY